MWGENPHQKHMASFLVRFTSASRNVNDARTYMLSYDINGQEREIELISNQDDSVQNLKENTFTHPIYRSFSNDGCGLTVYTTKDFYDTMYKPVQDAGNTDTDNTSLFFSFHVSSAGIPQVARAMCEKLMAGWYFLTPVSGQVEMVYHVF
jgi:hypothetical protein